VRGRVSVEDMTATVVERVGTRSGGRRVTVDDYARVCVEVLGAELTAYVAGADTVAEFDSWFRAPAQPAEVQRRLAAAAEIVSVFEMANKSACASAWLREMDEVGYVPARVLRQSTGDEISVKSLLEASVAFTLG
jgi:hypothetical protein